MAPSRRWRPQRYPLTRMTDNYALLNSLYRDNWVVQNVVGIIPDDMTKKWFAPAGAVGPEHLKELDRVQRVTRSGSGSTRDCGGAGCTAAPPDLS